MVSQRVDPEFVLVYIGTSVKYLTTSPSKNTEQAAGVFYSTSILWHPG